LHLLLATAVFRPFDNDTLFYLIPALALDTVPTRPLQGYTLIENEWLAWRWPQAGFGYDSAGGLLSGRGNWAE
jgi:hypothetical protein